jgi:hypothetical protein
MIIAWYCKYTVCQKLLPFHKIDPASQHASPYLAMSNSPVLFVDPDGLTDMNHSDGPRWGRRGAK